MQEYIVSARKYRPMTFDTVVGQSALTTTLKNAIATDKLAHAYLFCGPRGVGKTTCARIFAKTINCLAPRPDGECCGECESCKAFDEGRSMNIHELDAASNNSVEDIRELIKQVQIPPQIGRYKVFIIDEVHMLSSQAFNAFLKTLEEPPSYVIFVLATTEKHKILPTILSRCQVYDFQRMTVENTIAHLKNVAQKEGYTTQDEALQLIAEKADGGMRDALSIFDQMVSFTGGSLTYERVCDSLNVLSSEYYFRLTDHFLAHQVPPCMLLFNEILTKGFDGGNFIAGLARHMRQLLVAKDECTLPLLEVSERNRQRYQQQATKCSHDFIFQAIKLCNDCDQAYRQSHNKRLQVEICLIQCAQLTQEGQDTPSAGRGPAKILLPLFRLPSLAQPGVQAGSPAPQQMPRHTHEGSAPLRTNGSPHSIPAILQSSNTSQRRVPTIPMGQFGPSILAPARQEKPSPASQASQPATVQDKPFTHDDIIHQWHVFVERMPTAQRAMSMRMRVMMPRMINDYTFQVVVNNQQIAHDLHQLEGDILAHMHRALCNSSIRMAIHVAQAQEVAHITSKPALFQKMAQKNPSVKHLAELLHLVIN